VADDQPAVVTALELLLKGHGCVVRSASSPKAVLEALREDREPFDLLVMDLNYARDTTSGREGLELVAQVKDLDPALPVIAMTAWSTVPLAVATMREGVADFVDKPWDNARLLATVDQLVEAGRRRRRARRLEEDAREVQQRLLSRALDTEGVDVGAAWSCAEALGGDGFLVRRRPDGTLAAAILDVCGKGAPAALLMASALATLEGLLDSGLGPAEVCARLGGALQGRLQDDRYVSMALAVIDRRAGRLVHVNAGHPAPVLLRAGGAAARLERGGPVLGLLPGAAYEEEVVAFAAADRLVLMTDGILEAAREGTELGDADLVTRLRALEARPAADAASALLEGARTYSGSPLADDATVLVLDAREAGAHA
jgi:serine phosphatase RsbU (regulator of sigma subunit)